jgi:serine/threonine-protein phosphatase PP1 catalytic subunit
MDRTYLQQLIRNPERISKLNFDSVSNILSKSREIIEQETLLLEFNVEKDEEIYVIGDIHGNFDSLLELYNLINQKEPKLVIFLGDIVDRGPKQIECLIFILIIKILQPNKYFILRGNHETLEINQSYGFFHEFAHRFGNYDNFEEIIAIYNVLPFCAIINETILCLHGGIPEDFNILKKIKAIKTKDITNSILEDVGQGLFQIMWNDPKEGLRGFMRSYRGSGIYFFGEEVFDKFMAENKLQYLIRAHECFPEGYVWFFNLRLLSIFSAANYRGEFEPNPLSYAIIKNNRIFPINLELTLK